MSDVESKTCPCADRPGAKNDVAAITVLQAAHENLCRQVDCQGKTARLCAQIRNSYDALARRLTAGKGQS